MGNITEKKCSKCRAIKPLEEFYFVKTNKDNHGSWCKLCAKEYSKEYRKSDKQAIKTKQRIMENITEKRCPTCGIVKPPASFNLGREKGGLCWQYRECQKKDYRTNREKRLASVKERTLKLDFRARWAKATIYSHKKRGVLIGFSWEELLEKANKTDFCEICGRELSWYFGKGRVQIDSPTMDNLACMEELREIKDISIVCLQCNVTKNNRNMEEFISYCLKISSLDFLNIKEDNVFNKPYINDWARRTIYNHSKKGIIVNFSKSELAAKALKTKYCELCGVELAWGGGRGFLDSSPTLDNSNQLLELNDLSDTKIICNRCNLTKSNRTLNEFMDYCSMIANKYSMPTDNIVPNIPPESPIPIEKIPALVPDFA